MVETISDAPDVVAIEPMAIATKINGIGERIRVANHGPF